MDGAYGFWDSYVRGLAAQPQEGEGFYTILKPSTKCLGVRFGTSDPHGAQMSIWPSMFPLILLWLKIIQEEEGTKDETSENNIKEGSQVWRWQSRPRYEAHVGVTQLIELEYPTNSRVPHLLQSTPPTLES